MNSKDLLIESTRAIGDKKGEDIIALDMKGIHDISDYFLICHGNNERQVQAIAKAVKDKAYEKRYDVKRMEGYQEARWTLVDLSDVVVHIFHKDERDYYNLERLYQDATSYSYDEVMNLCHSTQN